MIRSEIVLYVDESKLRSKEDVDKLRGIAPSVIIRRLHAGLRDDLRTYLLRDVLEPMLAPQFISVNDALDLVERR